MIKCHYITINNIKNAHRYILKEQRDIFYRVATYHVKKAINGTGELNLAEAVSILLLTWNRRFYQGQRRFKMVQIERLLCNNYLSIVAYRQRNISSLSKNDKKPIITLFKKFEKKIGPVGTAKTLHLLAPKFFSIWDNKIAKAYGFYLRKGTNGERYFLFMKCQKEQATYIGNEPINGITVLKAIDEYNYCHYSKE